MMIDLAIGQVKNPEPRSSNEEIGKLEEKLNVAVMALEHYSKVGLIAKGEYCHIARQALSKIKE